MNVDAVQYTHQKPQVVCRAVQTGDTLLQSWLQIVLTLNKHNITSCGVVVDMHARKCCIPTIHAVKPLVWLCTSQAHAVTGCMTRVSNRYSRIVGTAKHILASVMSGSRVALKHVESAGARTGT